MQAYQILKKIDKGVDGIMFGSIEDNIQDLDTRVKEVEENIRDLNKLLNKIGELFGAY